MSGFISKCSYPHALTHVVLLHILSKFSFVFLLAHYIPVCKGFRGSVGLLRGGV